MFCRGYASSFDLLVAGANHIVYINKVTECLPRTSIVMKPSTKLFSTFPISMTYIRFIHNRRLFFLAQIKDLSAYSIHTGVRDYDYEAIYKKNAGNFVLQMFEIYCSCFFL